MVYLNKQGVKPPVQLRTEASSAEKKTALTMVPVDAIFKVEFAALETLPEHQKGIRNEYEKYVHGLMNAVSVWLGYSDVSKTDRQKLAKAVRKVDERELFSYVSEVFHKDFKASIEGEKMLAIAIRENIFNCYSSSVLLADAITRLGKQVNIILALGHVLLCGEKYAFETTDGNTESAIYEKVYLNSNYNWWQEADLWKLLSIAYGWAGVIFDDTRRYDEALEAYNEAIKINLDYAEAWNNKGVTLSKMHRYDEALEAYNEAIRINRNNAEAWNNKGVVFEYMHRYDEALEAYNEAIRLNPNLAEARNNKELLLYKMRKH